MECAYLFSATCDKIMGLPQSMKRDHYQKHFPKMIEQSLAGKSDTQIAAHYGLNPKTISSWLNSRTFLGLSEQAFAHLKQTRQARRISPTRLSSDMFETLPGESDHYPVKRCGYSGGRAWYRSENNPNAIGWPEKSFEATIFAIAGFSSEMPREAACECFSERVKLVELVMGQRGPSKRDILALVREVLRLGAIKEDRLLGSRMKLRRELNLLAPELQKNPEDPRLLINVGVWWMDYLRHAGLTRIPNWLRRLYVWDENGNIVRVAQESSSRAIRLVWDRNEFDTDYEIAVSGDIEPDGRIVTLTHDYQVSLPDGGYTTSTVTSIADARAAENRRQARLFGIR